MKTFIIHLCLFFIVPMTVHASTCTYTYDALGRLTNAAYTNGVMVTYDYDAMGNRMRKRVVLSANLDTDGDGIPDVTDACPTNPNDSEGDPCNHNDCSDFFVRDA